MKTSKRTFIPGAIMMALAITTTLLTGCTTVTEHKSAVAQQSLTPAEAQQIAMD